MLMKDFDRQYDVVMGNENDVCFYCLKEYQMKKENDGKSVVQAKKELSGNLIHKPIFKNRRIGDGFTICKDHIALIANEVGLTPEELKAKAKEVK